jgi:arylsulfatase A-like enzyme
MRRRRAVLACCALVVAGALAPAACRRAPARQRLVLLTFDTLRFDSFAGAPGRPSSMPRTLARAGGGLLFERFYAATSITQPSHASMLTGLHPWEHGVRRNGDVLAAGRTTVAETLRQAGWATAAVVASFPLDRRFGFAQGFDEYRQPFDRALIPSGRWEGRSFDGPFFTTADRVVDAGIAILDGWQADREFLWLHFFDPHSPYGLSTGLRFPGPLRVAALAADGKPFGAALARARQGYEADVAFLDRALERLFHRLDADAGRYQTHVVAAADHGESFGEEGSLAHGSRLTEAEIRVPLFVLSPRVEPSRRRDVAGSVDVAATLLALAGLPPAPHGRDLTAPPDPHATAVGMRRLFRPGRVETRLDGSRHPLDVPLFYLAEADGRLVRGNSRDLVDTPPDPAIEAALRRLFASFEDRLLAHPAAAPLDADTRRALEALGYLD